MSSGHYDEPPVQLDTNFGNVIIIDKLPVIALKRYEKLCAVVRKIFGKWGTMVQDGLYMPVGGDPKKTCGYAFIEYETPEMAALAVMEGDHKKLDNKHTLRVNLFDQYEKYAEMKMEYLEPKRTDYESKANLTSWLLDDHHRDQFVLRWGGETQVYWNDPYRKANTVGRELAYGGEREKAGDKKWTELYVAWSTHGAYLATFHHQGIALWGGESFSKLARFAHPGVRTIDFSPCEKFLVTCNGMKKEKPSDPDPIIVWDIRTAKKLRGFNMEDNSWPAFKWSHDDQFVARVTPDVISVYQTVDMGLVGKKSIAAKGVREILWSPGQNILSYWIPEKDQIPASVALIEFPSKKVVREKHIFKVVDVNMHWQDKGDYLAVKLSLRKTKKTLTTSFEFFRMRDKNIPVENLEIDDPVVAFAWQPSGNHFAFIHGDGPRPWVSFYKLTKKKLVLHHKTKEGRPANSIYWSPSGQHVILAGLGPLNGQLEFFDLRTRETLTQQEHFMCTDIEWCPSGRFLITAVTQPLNGGSRFSMENGYRLWTCMGDQLATVPTDQCYQVLWRPRPKCLLQYEEIQQIKKDLKSKYWGKFEQEEEEIRMGQLSDAVKERQRLKREWEAYRAEKAAEYGEEADMRADLRGGVLSDDDDDYEVVQQSIEEKISTEEVVLPSN